jgi:excisionase family DNA binding protein
VTGDPDDLLTVDEVIASLQVSRATFYPWRRRGDGPVTIRLPGGGVRIRRAALAGWLAGLQDGDEEGIAA